MALAKSHPIFSVENYLDFERNQTERHEFLTTAFMLWRAKVESQHNLFQFNHNHRFAASRKRCRGFSPNMKIATNDKGLYSYPDLAIVCGQPTFYDNKSDVITNPAVIFEVLSPSTENYDRGEKFLRYTNHIETLRNYVLISQDKAVYRTFSKQENGGWTKVEIRGIEAVLKLDSIECEISLAELYELIELAA